MTGLELSGWLVNRSIDEGVPLSTIQLQEVLYCIAVGGISARDPLFSDTFYAGPMGPILPDVWEKYSDYGLGRITRKESTEIPKEIILHAAELNQTMSECRSMGSDLTAYVKRLSNHAYERAKGQGYGTPIVLEVKEKEHALPHTMSRVESDVREILSIAKEPKVQFLCYEILHILKEQEKKS